VQADQSYLEQVLMNLVVNARDAMPKGGQIVLETKNAAIDDSFVGSHEGARPGNYVMIAVTDSGCGMSEEIKKQIFEPFFTTKEKGKGTGLGLSTSYGIVKQLGGHIDVYTEVGHGTTFKIYLPRVNVTGRLTAVSKEASEILPGGTETVLVVEDKREVRDAVTGILNEYGYRVLESENGMEALVVSKMYENERIHLLLTDVVMPRVSGQELASQILTSRPDIKIIFMSGYTDDAIAQDGVISSGIHFLQKPFTRETLLKEVRRTLDEGAA
jgi:CheY-like chemotaxis protein